MKRAAEQQGFVAKEWEKKKAEKYHNPPNFVPMIFEFPGSCGPKMKVVLQKCARRIAASTNTPTARVMNRIRGQLIANINHGAIRNIIRSLRL